MSTSIMPAERLAVVVITCCLFLCLPNRAHSQANTAAPRGNAAEQLSATAQRQRTIAWTLLKEGAGDSRTARREKTIHALGLLGQEPGAVKLAEAALQDKEPEVRAAAAGVLGEMRATQSVPKLVAAASDRETSVALAAARSLLVLKSDAGYTVYYAVLTGKRKSGGMIEQQWDELKQPKNAAEFAFEQGIGFVPYAGAAFEAIQMLTKKDPSPIRAAAAIALANDPDPRSGVALTRALADKNWIVRVAALRAIAIRGSRASLGAVEQDTRDARDEVRFAAAVTVIRLTEPE